MMESDIGPLLCLLYDLVKDAALRYKGVKRKGSLFEDEVSRCIYQFADEYGFESHPPRLTLDYSTFSGNTHQFDASLMKRNTLYLIECKNTKQAAKDYLYYFNAKIMDYTDHESNHALTFKGIFVTVVPVAESAMKYALAYGVRVISPELPPPEYILGCGDKSMDLLSRELTRKFNSSIKGLDLSTYRLLDEYRYLCSRWNDLNE